jgi:hypothetical protein
MKTRSFVKKPANGGTPETEKRITVIRNIL